jgi:ammonium transporter Rh
LDVTSLIVGDFGAAACMITFGALLGKADLFQMWILITLELVFYTLNEAIGVVFYQAVDIGGSMYIHTFGAYFGLAASYFFQSKKALKEHGEKCVGGYNSQTVAMVGTIFLFLFWPSFNSALAPALSQQRVVVNTTLSITASVIGACGLARILHQKLDMEIVLNATIAGGVIIGAASDVVVAPGVAIIIGGLGGMISAAGFAMLSGYLREKIGLHDTCGVHNLHGIPGVLGGLSGVITSALAGTLYKDTDQGAVNVVFTAVQEGRTFGRQATMQFVTLVTTIAISISSGYICGAIASKFGRTPKTLFDDTENWMHVSKDRKEAHEDDKGSHHDKHDTSDPSGLRATVLHQD